MGRYWPLRNTTKNLTSVLVEVQMSVGPYHVLTGRNEVVVTGHTVL